MNILIFIILLSIFIFALKNNLNKVRQILKKYLFPIERNLKDINDSLNSIIEAQVVMSEEYHQHYKDVTEIIVKRISDGDKYKDLKSKYIKLKQNYDNLQKKNLKEYNVYSKSSKYDLIVKIIKSNKKKKIKLIKEII